MLVNTLENEPIEKINNTVVLNIPKQVQNQIIALKPLPKNDESSEQPIAEKIKDNASAISGCVAFGANLCTSIPFIFEQLGMIKNVTSTMNFIIFPIVMIISTFVYFFMPVSISYLRDKVEKLNEKQTCNAYEMREIENMLSSLSNTHETMTQKTGIKPFSACPSNTIKNYLQNQKDVIRSNEEDEISNVSDEIITFFDPSSGKKFALPEGFVLNKK